MSTRTYLDKEFIVVSNQARIRRADNLEEAERYAPGDPLPLGAAIGQVKIIKKRTLVRVTNAKAGAAKTLFVLAEPIDESAPSGWTLGTNLEGGLINETIGLCPSDWDAEPNGATKTCIDTNALLRHGPPHFAPKGEIPFKSYCVVTDSSEDGRFVKVNRAETGEDRIEVKEELGWTAASSLADGCSAVYFSADWLDEKGPNACWRRGSFIGAKVLVNIVGRGGEIEQITFDSLDAYNKLKDEAKQDGITLAIESGFRTFEQQAELRRLFESGKGNKAAKAGHSNHQHGKAFDLNTHSKQFDGDPIYDWLKKNAPRLGFIRTVGGEPWHWEYVPDEAAVLLATGKFKRDGVSP
jgi:hypothetical protein